MIIIKCVDVDGVLCPETDIPTNAVMIFCDGTNYTVYMPGDELPEVGGNG